MRKPTFIFYLFFLVVATNAVSQECGTVVPEAYQTPLEELSGKRSNIYRDDKVRVPLSLHFVLANQSAYTVDMELIQDHIKSANFAFAKADIEFFLCADPDIIAGESKYSMESSTPLHDKYVVPNTLNIYIVERLDNLFLAAFTTFPERGNVSKAKIVMKGLLDAGIFVHELGHYFGLLHTHETINGDELVNRTNCRTAGDALCDTPADPNLAGFNIISCQYQGNVRDSNGQVYRPSAINYMSNTTRECRRTFSPEQFDRMRAYANVIYSFKTQCHGLTLGTSDAFPNPTRKNVKVLLSNELQGDMQINIRNTLGHLLSSDKALKQIGQQEVILNFENLPKGLYLIEIKYLSQKQSENIKVIKL